MAKCSIKADYQNQYLCVMLSLKFDTVGLSGGVHLSDINKYKVQKYNHTYLKQTDCVE